MMQSTFACAMGLMHLSGNWSDDGGLTSYCWRFCRDARTVEQESRADQEEKETERRGFDCGPVDK